MDNPEGRIMRAHRNQVAGRVAYGRVPVQEERPPQPEEEDEESAAPTTVFLLYDIHDFASLTEARNEKITTPSILVTPSSSSSSSEPQEQAWLLLWFSDHN